MFNIFFKILKLLVILMFINKMFKQEIFDLFYGLCQVSRSGGGTVKK